MSGFKAALVFAVRYTYDTEELKSIQKMGQRILWQIGHRYTQMNLYMKSKRRASEKKVRKSEG